MSLQATINIDIDVYDKKHILINAKQLDNKSRFISATCYSHGELLAINSGEHAAYIRYRKPDEYSVFNFCQIDRYGKILIELTEQMLASAGICRADLIIVNKGSANVNTSTGEITTIDGASILSTMTFYIDVQEASIDNSEVESSYEFSGLNEALERFEAEYKNVSMLAKSYATGNAGGIRENEDYDNAKYYAELALKNAYGGDSIVIGIKCGDDTTYRTGRVTINADDVGAIPSNDIATINEVKNYLGI